MKGLELDMKRDYLENKNFYKQNNLKYSMNNKRGQGLSVNAIIMIVLGVAVLALLILGFTRGWGTIFPFLKTNNVDTIVKACATACATDSTYDYCTTERDLKDGEGNKIKTSCAVFSVVPEFNKYGIEECNIACDLACTEIMIDEENANEVSSLDQAECSVFNTKSNCEARRTCIWTPGTGCSSSYKVPSNPEEKGYDVTDLTGLNPSSTLCVVPN